MKNYRLVLLLGVIGLATFWLWPRPLATVLSKKIQQLCIAAELTKPLTPIEARFKAKELSTILGSSIFIHYRAADDEFTRTVKKSEAFDGITAGLTRITSLKVVFSNFKVISSTPDSAQVSLFIIAEWTVSGEAELNRAAEDTRLFFEHVDGDWKVIRVETLPRLTL